MQTKTGVVTNTNVAVATAILLATTGIALIGLPDLNRISRRGMTRQCQQLYNACYYATSRRLNNQETICAQFLQTCGFGYHPTYGYGYGYTTPSPSTTNGNTSQPGYGYGYGYGYPPNPSPAVSVGVLNVDIIPPASGIGRLNTISSKLSMGDKEQTLLKIRFTADQTEDIQLHNLSAFSILNPGQQNARAHASLQNYRLLLPNGQSVGQLQSAQAYALWTGGAAFTQLLNFTGLNITIPRNTSAEIILVADVSTEKAGAVANTEFQFQIQNGFIGAISQYMVDARGAVSGQQLDRKSLRMGSQGLIQSPVITIVP